MNSSVNQTNKKLYYDEAYKLFYISLSSDCMCISEYHGVVSLGQMFDKYALIVNFTNEY